MKFLFKNGLLLLPILFLLSFNAMAGGVKVLENNYIKRELSIVSGVLKTTSISNKLLNHTTIPLSCDEFVIRLSNDASSPSDNDIVLSSKDFSVKDLSGDGQEVVAVLENKQHRLNLKVHYTLNPNDFYAHKYIEIVSGKSVVLELVDIEVIALKDAYETFQAKDMMWTSKKFLPSLGQPIYVGESASFWGIEFPASWNRVENNSILCGVQGAIDLVPNQVYVTHKAVFGVGNKTEDIKEAFLEYIDRIRANPFALHVQYNSWFDFGASITQEKFLQSMDVLHNELVVKRGCKPLSVYVIDDGWQTSRPPRVPLTDWSNGMYLVNEERFGAGLSAVKSRIEEKGSKMGIWASPACLFGASANCAVLKSKGFETLVGSINSKSNEPEMAMCMTGEKYMDLLEEALLRMAGMGAQYFKLDGIFGNMKYRFFPVTPGMGSPVMSHLLPSDITANDPRLNDPKFDEMKRYYITRSTERLVSIYQKMLAINPKVRIMNHNGATISPWWLMTSDVISLVNQQDGAPGDDRNSQMCYRDAIYYQSVVKDNIQIPINSIFNHEPSKDNGRFGDQDINAFRNYFFMALSRGTTMVELYVSVRSLSQNDFDVLAEGLKWLEGIYPAFKRSRMHGGNPLGNNAFDERNVELRGIDLDKVSQVYGFTGWSNDLGFVSIHNPKSTMEIYEFKLDHDFGLLNEGSSYVLSSPMSSKIEGIKPVWKAGETFKIEVQPKDVVILNFKAR